MLVDSSGKKKAYLKAKIDEHETVSKIKKILGAFIVENAFKKSYQPRINIMKDNKEYLVTDYHIILARRRKYFSQLLNVLSVNEVRQR
jgi:hypothetical protein